MDPFLLNFGRHAPAPEKSRYTNANKSHFTRRICAINLIINLKQAPSEFEIIKADLRRSQRDHYDSISRHIEIPTGKIVYIRNHTQPSEGETFRFIRNFDGPYIVHSHCFNRPDLLVLQDPTTNHLLKLINIEKIVVAPEAQDILDQSDYDIDIPSPEPAQISTVPDLKEIASKFANYLLQQPNYSAYSSEACKRIYQVLSSRELLNHYDRSRGLISQCRYLSLKGGKQGGTYVIQLDKALYDK